MIALKDWPVGARKPGFKIVLTPESIIKEATRRHEKLGSPPLQIKEERFEARDLTAHYEYITPYHSRIRLLQRLEVRYPPKFFAFSLILNGI